MKEVIPQHRNHNLGVRVSAHQKAEYQQIAKFHDLSTSEWASIIIECNKHTYPNINKPTSKEQQLALENVDLKSDVLVLKKEITKKDIEIASLKKENTDNIKVNTEYQVAIKDITDKYRFGREKNSMQKQNNHELVCEIQKIIRSINTFSMAEQQIQSKLEKALSKHMVK